MITIVVLDRSGAEIVRQTVKDQKEELDFWESGYPPAIPRGSNWIRPAFPEKGADGDEVWVYKPTN
jgi:hypothetical protein